MSTPAASPATLEFMGVARDVVPGVRSGAMYRARGQEAGVHRGLPSTTLTMVFSLDGPVVSLQDDPVGGVPVGPPLGERPSNGAADGVPLDRATLTGCSADLVLAGLHTDPVLLEQPTRQEGVQLEVDPLAARTLFGVRTADLLGAFDGSDVLGRTGRELLEQVGEVSTAPERLTRISRDFRDRAAAAASHGGPMRAEVAEAWRLVLASRGRIGVAALADHVLLSPRQLRTEFHREFGLGPKSAARLARFEAALEQIAGAVHAGRSPELSGTAAATGYADHAHLTREFRRFTGTSPSAWIAEERRNLLAGGHGTAQD